MRKTDERSFLFFIMHASEICESIFGIDASWNFEPTFPSAKISHEIKLSNILF